MSRSDRSRHIAAASAGLLAIWVLSGLLAFSYHLGDLSASKRTQSYRFAAQYPADTDKRIADCPSDRSVSSLKQCIEEAITASHDAQRSERDLSAQRQMADWAFWVLVVSFGGTVITAIGTVFLAIQIKLTREAVNETGLATQAMIRQNYLAEQSQRPWININVDINEAVLDGERNLVVIFRFENIGQTVARDILQVLGGLQPLDSAIENYKTGLSPFGFGTRAHAAPPGDPWTMTNCTSISAIRPQWEKTYRGRIAKIGCFAAVRYRSLHNDDWLETKAIFRLHGGMSDGFSESQLASIQASAIYIDKFAVEAK